MGAPKGNKYAQKYTDEEIIEKAIEYIEDEDNIFPSIAGLASYMNISRETVYARQEKNDKVSDIVSVLLTNQEKNLLEKGLTGDYNSSVAKMILGRHGYADKKSVDMGFREEVKEQGKKLKEALDSE